MGHATFSDYLLNDEADDDERRQRRDLLLSGTKKILRRADSASTKYSAVDLFCGCGGFSTGLEATGRFKVLLGIDVSESALATFALNHGDAKEPVKTIEADLGKIKALTIRSELRALGILTGELDLLVGGPPCEGFSQNRAQRSEKIGMYDFLINESHATSKWDSRGAATSVRRKAEHVARSERKDERNRLFRVMLRVAAVIRPKVVLIENVRELLTYRDGAVKNEIVRTLQRLGYSVEVRILNAADYGVPQVRRRAFILAVRGDVVDGDVEALFPLPTHVPSNAPGRVKGLPGEAGKYVSVWEAIGDLPLPRTAKGTRSRDAFVRKIATSKYRRYARRKGPVSAHEERTLSKSVLARIRYMKPGMRSHDLPARLRTKKFFYNAYARLSWNKPANTITKSFVYLGSGKFGHPEQNRGLTIREAARLQSFPDDFRFCDAPLKMLATMVGGAVPPLLAKAFGLRLAGLLDAKNKSNYVDRARLAGISGGRPRHGIPHLVTAPELRATDS